VEGDRIIGGKMGLEKRRTTKKRRGMRIITILITVGLMFLLTGCVTTPTNYEASKSDGSIVKKYELKQLIMKDGQSFSFGMILASGGGSTRDEPKYIFYAGENNSYRMVKVGTDHVVVYETNEKPFAECHYDFSSDCFMEDSMGYWVLAVPKGNIAPVINSNLNQLQE
jgi:hypothetical protein